MSTIYIQARVSDGEIVAHSNALPLVRIDGCDLLSKEIEDGAHCVPDPMLHKVDWLIADLVDKSVEEQALARAPQMYEVRIAIAQELAATDAYIVHDRPMSQATRAAWTHYRQLLRDLSKQRDDAGRLLTPTEIIDAWPARPDGPDAVAQLRTRMMGS